ncbi:Uncharacterized protein APZ42_011402 [Daphnia magna]|uniref:Uncharacterized protein n=1 Tax=Daphnia magna TaxID=35525 RepID=A0A162CZ36_9CRUS|nr:Uncharacterized protein APZ42_011402 [Daphnia magna]
MSFYRVSCFSLDTDGRARHSRIHFSVDWENPTSFSCRIEFEKEKKKVYRHKRCSFTRVAKRGKV